MKQYRIVVSLLCCLFLYSSCVDESEITKKEVVEGIPVDVTLSFTSPEMQQITTRADMGAELENSVKDLRVFVFRKNGDLEKLFKYPEEAAEKMTAVSTSLKLTGLTSGEKRIVAIANLSSADIEDIKNEVDQVEKWSDLQQKVATLSINQLVRPAGFVMSGYWGKDLTESLSETGLCELDASKASNGTITLGGKLFLRHLDSKIKFDVTIADDEAGLKEFIPTDWRVCQVPNKSYLFDSNVDASVEEGHFFNQEQAYRFESTDFNNLNRYKGGSFVFYMSENRKPAKEEINDYALREKQEKDEKGLNGAYLYADPRSTYVVIRGTYYEYDNEKKIKTSADVRYTIHLGYVNNVASDFNSERGKSYTYKVSIKNVENIKLEVESSQEGYGGDFQEKQPGAEGDVVIADQSLLLDAHYEVQSITFSKDHLSNLSVEVNTPYESFEPGKSGYFEIKDGQTTDHLTDYEWVEFAKITSGKGYMSYTEAKSKNKLQTIKEVLEDLNTHKNDKNSNRKYWDNNGKATYTIFVNEFYYDKEPASGSTTSWKKFVNVKNRQMHILCNTKYSLDQQSSLTTSSILISQRSIKSIYNVENSSLETAWGIETVREETKQFPSLMLEKGVVYKDTKTNGLYNMFAFWDDGTFKGNKSTKWVDYVTVSNNSFAPGSSDRQYAEYICLHRNRDINGDGVINDDEIRWYLPATNQYVGLWIGQDALPAEARLLQGAIKGIDEDNRFTYHLMGSNGIRFWTEEGVSTGNTVANKNAFYVRCARNLGTKVGKPGDATDQPEDYVTVEKSNDCVISVDVSKLSPMALRSEKFTTIDGFHAEHTGGSMNYLYKGGFSVNDKNTKSSTSYNKGNGTGKIPTCPQGYRIPNQRELALIAGYSGSKISVRGSGKNTVYDQLPSCTYSALGYKKDIYTLAFRQAEGNFLTLSGNSTDYVRCVKDGR